MLTVWDGDFDRILILQKKALRIIHGSKYNAHADPLFLNSKILKVQDQYQINMLNLIWFIWETPKKFVSETIWTIQKHKTFRVNQLLQAVIHQAIKAHFVSDVQRAYSKWDLITLPKTQKP